MALCVGDRSLSLCCWGSNTSAQKFFPIYLLVLEVKAAKARQNTEDFIATGSAFGLCWGHLPRPRRIDLAAICAANPPRIRLTNGIGAHLSEPHNVAVFFSIGSSTYWTTLSTPYTAIPIGFAVGFGE